MLFQVVRGGIEWRWVFGRSRGPTSPKILTLDLIRSEHTDDERAEFIVLPANRSKRLCRRIQFLRIKRLSFLPNRQCNSGDLATQRQSRHLWADAFLFQTLKITAVGLGATSGGRGADEDLLHTVVAVPIQSASCDRFSASHDTTIFHLVFRAHVRDHGQPTVTP